MDKLKVFSSGDLADLQKQLDAFVTDKYSVLGMQCSVSAEEYFVVLHYREK